MSSNRNDRSTLGYLGADFQLKLVKCFFEDQKYFSAIQDIVDQNMFSNEHLRRIVGFMKDRYNFNETVTTYFEMETIIRSKVSDAISVEQLLAHIEKIKEMDLSGMDLVEEESEKFFKQQNLTKAINKAQDIIKKGDFSNYYAIEDIVKKALEVNTKQDFGFRLFDNIESDLKEDYRSAIPTGAEKLDKALYGGLAKGELGVIVAPPGIGKSSTTTGFAANAAITKNEYNNYNGYKVLHFFFEDEEINIRRKYYGFVTDIDACTLSLPDVRPIAIQKLNEDTDVRRMLRENVICERLSTGEVRASEIKNKIRQYIARGFKPDLIIIDYFECIKFEKSDVGDSEWSKEGVTMRKLESMAKEFNVAMWVPVQGTRDSIGAEIVGLMQAGGSVKKTQIAHVVITMGQTDEMKTQGRVNMFLGKFRAGRIDKNKFLNVYLNNGTCKFDMSEMDDGVDLPYEQRQTNRMNEIARETKQTYQK
jgi:replicative DNA helicase